MALLRDNAQYQLSEKGKGSCARRCSNPVSGTVHWHNDGPAEFSIESPSPPYSNRARKKAPLGGESRGFRPGAGIFQWERKTGENGKDGLKKRVYQFKAGG